MLADAQLRLEAGAGNQQDQKPTRAGPDQPSARHFSSTCRCAVVAHGIRAVFREIPCHELGVCGRVGVEGSSKAAKASATDSSADGGHVELS